MLQNSKFSLKIALLPAVAAAAFLVILATSWITGQQGTNLLRNIENGYYSSLELNRQLHDDLESMQRTFQDAASMADQEFLDEADAIRESFVSAVEVGKNNTVIDLNPLIQLETEFAKYFQLAQSSTQGLIDGSAGEDVYENLQTVSELHRNLIASIESMASRDQKDVSEAFANAQNSQRNATLFLIVIAAISLIVLVAASVVIIRQASQSIRTTVDGINALATGDLSKEFSVSAKDEMGHMVDRVTYVIRTVNALANEVQGLIDSMRAGKLQVRGEPKKFQGAYARLIGNINELIDAFVAPIGVTAGYVERISRGDIPPRVREAYQGDFNQTKENLNALVSTMGGLIHETAAITSAAKAGDLEKRGNPAEFSGVWRELVMGINETLDAVTGPFQEVSQVMSAMAHGDLNSTSDGVYKGEFAKLQTDINSTISKLTEVISGIKRSGDAVSSVSSEIAEGNRSLRLRTEDQASSLRNTSGTMTNMTSMVRQNATNAQLAKKTVIEASEKAKKGGAVVGKAVRAMDAINASSKKIADIINVIDEIAFQTNLLALNAAVEAARAGEEGRGFAVVASEVRNLAGRSAMAAKEINELIQDSVGKVDEGSRLVHESGQTLEEIVSAVIDVTNIVTEISESSQEQTVSIEDVNQAIAAMDAMTKKNAELADDAVRASDLMGQEAQDLNQMTSFFTTRADSLKDSAPGAIKVSKFQREPQDPKPRAGNGAAAEPLLESSEVIL